jgi:hypothetical protein
VLVPEVEQLGVVAVRLLSKSFLSQNTHTRPWSVALPRWVIQELPSDVLAS